MRFRTRYSLLLAAAALLSIPTVAVAAGPPSNPGGTHKQADNSTGSTAVSSQTDPGPGAGLTAGQAYGVYCRTQSKTHVAGQTGTPFSQCVTAMAKAANGTASTAKAACAGVSKKHVAGEKGSAYSQCVTAAAKLLESQHGNGLRLDRKALLPKACNGKGATLLVNVTFTLTNDADSGFPGNEWASDTIHRKLRIWHEANGNYCAVVGDTGSFTTLAGTSPNKTGTLSAGVTGRLQGGYVATFSGTPAATAPYAGHGNLGSFDLQCDQSFDCPGAHPSFTSYFDPAPSYTLTAWGWIYRTAKNGTWVNQSAGSSGDITG
ncbi:MAG TPA: hypothetical protein VE127_11875 [Solirubrobacteraceae bacterium]|nr:hypothetical protein [Solirubrobacteraceae bacterium]